MNDPDAKAQNPESEDEPLLGGYEPDREISTPIFVEVITEEAVEYLAPERPASTEDLVPEPGPDIDPPVTDTDTMPYPIISRNAETDEDLLPDPITEETDDSRPIPRPFGTTAPLIPKPGRDKEDSESGN